MEIWKSYLKTETDVIYVVDAFFTKSSEGWISYLHYPRFGSGYTLCLVGESFSQGAVTRHAYQRPIKKAIILFVFDVCFVN
jgi:hypothetical protein